MLLLLSQLRDCQAQPKAQPNSGVPRWARSPSRCGQAGAAPCSRYPSRSSPGLSPLSLHPWPGLGAGARLSQVVPHPPAFTDVATHQPPCPAGSCSSRANTKGPPQGHGTAPSPSTQALGPAPNARATFPAHPKPPNQRALTAPTCRLQKGRRGCSPLQAGLGGPAPPPATPSPAEVPQPRRGRPGEPHLQRAQP